VLASSNPGKLEEITSILKGCNIEVISQSKFNLFEIEETGKTFVENAILKARVATRISGLPAIADDSGLEVDILGGEPGIYSARYAGKNATDEENLQLLIRNILDSGVSLPKARFQCVIVYLRYSLDPMPLIVSGTWEGIMVSEPRGNNGFGYDPIFYVPTHDCTSAELDPDEKNCISHRGQALQKFVEYWRGVYEI